MNSELRLASWMAVRQLLGGRNPFSRFIYWVSVTGLALGVMALIVVVSVMNGFDRELRSRILNLIPHVLVLSDQVPASVHEAPETQAVFRFFQGQGMVINEGVVNPVVIHALDSGGVTALSELRENVVYGDLAALERVPGGIALGRPLAAHLGLFPGDSVTVVVTRPTASGSVQPRLLRFQLVATFEVGAELDYSLVLVGYDAVQTGLGESGQDGWRVVLDDALAASRLVTRWRSDSTVTFEDWTASYGELFQAVRLEKAMMFVLLLLVVAVAAFNIITGQLLLVNDKRGEIGILRTMGASGAQVVATFFLQGAFVALAGILVGVATGTLLALNITQVVTFFEELFGVQLLAGTYFEQVPSVVLLSDILTIALVSAVLCLAAAALPARRTTAINPIEALHGA